MKYWFLLTPTNYEPKRRDHFENLDVDGKISLKRMFRKWDIKA
jgi:hypothetical protein